MNIIDGTLSITKNSRGIIKVSFTDTKARIKFVEAEILPIDFTNALFGLNEVKCSIKVNAKNVGKVKEQKHFSFEITYKGYSLDKQKAKAIKIGNELCPEGWIMFKSFNTQTSFEHLGNNIYKCNTTIQRWV